MLKLLLKHLRTQHVPQPALAELAELANMVAGLSQQVSTIAGSLVVIDFILRDAGIFSDDRLERLKPQIKALFAPPLPPGTSVADIKEAGGSEPSSAL